MWSAAESGFPGWVWQLTSFLYCSKGPWRHLPPPTLPSHNCLWSFFLCISGPRLVCKTSVRSPRILWLRWTLVNPAFASVPSFRIRSMWLRFFVESRSHSLCESSKSLQLDFKFNPLTVIWEHWLLITKPSWLWPPDLAPWRSVRPCPYRCFFLPVLGHSKPGFLILPHPKW